MKAFEVPDLVINTLKYFVRNYEGITRLLVAAKNRQQSINPDSEAKFDHTCQSLESEKDWISRRIKKELEYWDVWLRWLDTIPGIGSWLGASLILSLFYRFMPVCSKCGTTLEKKEQTFWCSQCERSVKGDGNLNYTIEHKEFKNISSWWKYMGRHVVEGKVPKRKHGETSNWSTKGRTLGYHIAESFIKQNSGHRYRAIYDERKAYREETHADATKGYRHNMAQNETVKLFLAHFMAVAYEIEGLPCSEPYANKIMGHSGYIKPFYWEPRGS